MHAKKTFWHTLECVPGLSDVTASWLDEMGNSEFELAQTFLRPRGRLAMSYPRLDNTAWGPVYEVVCHGPDNYVGVCPGDGKRIELTAADLTIYEIDRADLARAVTTALGCELQFAPTDLYSTSRLGTYEVTPGMRCPVYWVIALEQRLFRSAVDRLAATNEGPFLLLSPTRRRWTPDAETLLHSKGSACIAMCEALSFDEKRQLQPSEAAQTLMNDFRRLALAFRRPPTMQGEPYVFRFQGNVWTMTFEGETVFMEDMRGLRYIAWLLARPAKNIPVPVLVAEVSGNKAVAGSIGERLDAEALTAYRERLADLQEEIAEAEQYAD